MRATQLAISCLCAASAAESVMGFIVQAVPQRPSLSPLASSFLESDRQSSSDSLQYPSRFSSSSSSSPASSDNDKESTSSSASSSSAPPPAFLLNSFLTSSPFSVTADACDDQNRPPSLNILLRTLHQLTRQGSSTDIRGLFVNHKRLGRVSSVAHEIGRHASGPSAPLTPFAAYCLGYGMAQFVLHHHQEQQQGQNDVDNNNNNTPIRIALGQDPRPHGMRLADAFARGAESVAGVQVKYTGIATTPACAAFGRLHQCQASVMITASHLPIDRNGMKLFYRGNCLTKEEIGSVGSYASECAVDWYTKGLLPPASGDDAVMCHEWVDYMPAYAASLKRAIQEQVMDNDENDKNDDDGSNCLQGLNIVLNAGHGSGGFFKSVLKNLGANVEGSIGVLPDDTFPLGIPNPEYKPMIDETIAACQEAHADLGIMLDTDSDRCGFVVPTSKKTTDGGLVVYEALNRNRLIAIMGVILSKTHPGCAIVTDSVTSEGLATFLEETLGLKHVRYLKGYQNVIDKAKELTETGVLNAELAMETSGHGAMRENHYLDDGTYTAVKIVSLLAQQKRQQKDGTAPGSLLDLIEEMKEVDVVEELRFQVKDNSLESMRQTFDFCALEIERLAESNDKDKDDAVGSWSIDLDNLEGIRIRVGDGQFFMLRKSLHDPIISLQIEATSREEASRLVVDPLLKLFESEEQIRNRLDLSVLRNF